MTAQHLKTPADDPAPRGPGARRTQHAAWIPLVVIGLTIGAAFIGVYVGLQRSPAPQGLPVAVVGTALSAQVQTALGGAVDVTTVDDDGAGEALVRSGDAVAVLAATSPTSLALRYAGASGMTESGAARRLVAGLASRTGATVTETDVLPLTVRDTAGLSAFYVVFGVTLSSFVLAQGLSGAAGQVRLRHRVAVVGGFAVVIGLVAATLAGPVLGSLTPSFWQMTLIFVLLSAASAMVTKALAAWLGPPGIGVAVLTLTILGNATSGATIGYHLLPGWAQAVSGLLPPGAAFRAVRDFGYFDGSHVVGPLLTLLAWAAGSLALVVLRHRLAQRRTEALRHEPAPGPPPAHRRDVAAVTP